MRAITQLTNHENRRGTSMKLQSVWMLVLALMFAMASSACAQQSAGVLLQSGLYNENVNGDLEAAIEIYERVLKEYPEDRPVAAKALFHIGLCYEKLGKQEAQKAYQRLLKEYGDQSDLIAEARIRLTVLSRDNGKSEVTVRQIWAPSREPVITDNSGTPSPDGNYLSFTNWTHGNLAIRDLATGEYRDLTDEGIWDGADRFAGCSIWSPDSKQIAYAWWNRDHHELRIAPIDGSKPRILYRNKEKKWQHGDLIVPFAWSRDGKYILAMFRKKLGTNEGAREIALIATADGSVNVLKSFKGLLRSRYDWMSLSPNGRYVVYARPMKEDEKQRDIFLLATDGSGKEASLVEHPADDYGSVWSPDGKSIVFVSDRSGSYDTWLIQVADGEPVGKPRLVKRDVGEIQPMGFTRQGSLYYGLSGDTSDVYEASIDAETGELLDSPVKAILRFEGRNRTSAWSGDGKRLAYVSLRPSSESSRNKKVLVIRSIDTGQEKELTPQARLQQLRWSPDGRSILCGRSLEQIDVQTGNVTHLVRFDPEKVMIEDAAWSPDGKTIFYIKRTASTRDILARDLKTGKEKKVREGGVSWPGLAVSPDGRELAFTGWDKLKKDTRVLLMVIPAVGGQTRILHQMDHAEGNKGFAFECPPVWTMNGRYVLFGTRNPNELWRVHAAGGEAQKLLEMEGLRDLSVHPDGRRITFTGGHRHAMEVWAMENFLPESTSGN
ncbi:MAG: PD40 domain-containing protein [Phycisphaerales bacterium]|nr:MAG: PD40 domain-containing protein [Phycisphaerales bacterium]